MRMMTAAIVGLLIAGCAGTAHHRRYTWSPSTANDCPASFAEDPRVCLDPGYIPVLFGGGPAIWRGAYQDCMRARGYQQVGDVTRVPASSAPQLMEWEKHAWPWPENPPASAWAGVRRFGGVDFFDAACRSSASPSAPKSN